MLLSDHIRVYSLATIGWLIFIVMGLPHYYQNWELGSLIRFCIGTFFALGITLFWLIMRCHGRLLNRAFWIGFYATVPLLLYDYLYIHYILGQQFDLWNKFWYLSCFYIIPWIQVVYLIFYIQMNEKKVWALLCTGLAFILISIVLRGLWASFEGNFFDTMSDYPERTITMLESALKYSVYGCFLSSGILFIIRSAQELISKD